MVDFDMLLNRSIFFSTFYIHRENKHNLLSITSTDLYIHIIKKYIKSERSE